MTDQEFSTYMKDRKIRHQKHLKVIRESIDQVIKESKERFKNETVEIIARQYPPTLHSEERKKKQESHSFRRTLLSLLKEWTPKTFIPELAQVSFDLYDNHVVFHIDIPLDMTYTPTGETTPPDEGCN